MAQYTNRTDCVSSDYVNANLQYLSVATKIISQFFDPKLGLQTSSLYGENALNRELYFIKKIKTTQVLTTQYDNPLYNYPLADGEQNTYYNVFNDDLTAFNRTASAERNKNYLLSQTLY